jgi:hypothetical protein
MSAEDPFQPGAPPTGDRGAAGGPPSPPPEVARELALQLGGDLPCVRCRYNLRGLSIRGQCPECGLPVRATVLAVVDPQARLLQPLTRPRLTALGLVAWASFGLAAALLTVLLRLSDAAAFLGAPAPNLRWAAWAGTACILLSGVGAVALVRPHTQVPRADARRALVGVAAYLPLAALHWFIQRVLDNGSPPPYLRSDFADPARAAYHLAFAAVLLLVIFNLRPNARQLWERSFLMRTGRIDRQTMYALAGAVAVGAAGDLMHLLSSVTGPGPGDLVVLGGTVLIGLSAMLQVLGLAGILLDACRLYPVVVEPAPTLRDLLAKRGPELAGRRGEAEPGRRQGGEG